MVAEGIYTLAECLDGFWARLQEEAKWRSDFDPPYDSPIEEAFAWEACKHTNRVGTNVHKQAKIRTATDWFRLDFIFGDGKGRAVGVECDGKGFHTDLVKDEFRDALILETGRLQAIYRFQGHDIWYRPWDCLYFMALWDPWIFSTHGLGAIRHKASLDRQDRTDIDREAVARVENYHELDCWEEEEYDPPRKLKAVSFLQRRSPDLPWIQQLIRVAQKKPRRNLGQLVAQSRPPACGLTELLEKTPKEKPWILKFPSGA